MPHTQVHSIDTDRCGPLENWEKNFRPLRPESERRTYDPRGDHSQTRGGYTNRGCGRGRTQGRPLYCMFHERDTDHRMRDCPIFLKSKKKMIQKHNQPSTPSTAKEVNHTSHWHQPSQYSSSNQRPYQNFNPHLEYQSNYHRYPSQYYQPYNYTPHTSQAHTPQPTITYPLTPSQIMYPAARSQAAQPKTEPNNPPPPLQQSQDSSQQASSFPTFKTIHTITRGSNITLENKREKREHYRQVNHVAVKGPIARTKWSHVQITFTKADINLTSVPHTNAMVITAHIDKWNATRVLVDNESQAEILFLSTFEQMGFSKKQLKEASKSLYGFRGKKIEPVGSILLPVSFSTPSNARSEYITFDVVDMSNPYNAIFRRGLLNTFKAVLHSLYLCLKVPATLGVISVHGNQKDARNIEQDFAPCHRNVNCLQDEKEERSSSITRKEGEGSSASRPIELECETKRVPLTRGYQTKL
jgi:hypothetical protein